MPESSLCMICLRSDRVLKSYEAPLLHFHNELCNYSLQETRKALYCSECAWNLRKFHKFKQKCINADKLLQVYQKINMTCKIRFLEKQPTSLDHWDGMNSKTFWYVEGHEIVGANTPDRSISVSKADNASNYSDSKAGNASIHRDYTAGNALVHSDAKIKVENFTTCDVLNSLNNIKINTGANLLNPVVNLSRDNLLYRYLYIDQKSLIDYTKHTANTENGNIIKYSNDLTPLLKTVKKDQVCADNVDPFFGLDVLDNLKQSNDDDDSDDNNDSLEQTNASDENPLRADKYDIEFLDDDFTDNAYANNEAQDTEATDFDDVIATHTVQSTCKADTTVGIANISSVKNTASDVNNDITSNFNNSTTPLVGCTPITATYLQTHVMDINVSEPRHGVSLSTEPNKNCKRVPDNLLNTEVFTQSNKENKYLMVMKQLDGPKYVPQGRKLDSVTLSTDEHCLNNNSRTMVTTDIFGVDSDKYEIVNMKQINDVSGFIPNTVNTIHRIHAMEIDRLSKIKNKKNPMKRHTHLNSKINTKLKVNINRSKFYVHLENGMISLRHKKSGKIVKNLKKKKQINVKKIANKHEIKKTKPAIEAEDVVNNTKLSEDSEGVINKTKLSNVSTDVIIEPTLSNVSADVINEPKLLNKSEDIRKKTNLSKTSKEVTKNTKLTKAQRYRNLLSFVDKSKFKTKRIVKKYTDRIPKENNVKENDCTSKMDIEPNNDDELIYPQDLLEDTGKDGQLLCEKVGLHKENNTSQKTLKKLTNTDIHSDDHEIKNVATKDIIINSEHNYTDANIFDVNSKIVEIAAVDLENQNLIEYDSEICNTKYYVIVTNNTGTEQEHIAGNKEGNSPLATDDKEESNKETRKDEETFENKKNPEDVDLEAESLASKFAGQLLKRRVFNKLREVLDIYKKIKTEDGNLINKDSLLHFFSEMSYEDKWRVAKAMAEIGRSHHLDFPPEAAKILWELQNKYDDIYSSIFEIVYLDTEEKVLSEFQQRRFHKYANAKFKCDLCLQAFQCESAYTYHMKWHDPSHGEYECTLCHTWYTKKVNLYRHNKQQHSAVYSCKLCGMITREKNRMIKHCQLHKGQKVTCKICGEQYSYSSYGTHRALHIAKHECNMCARNFASVRTLNEHKRVKHPDLDENNFPEPTMCDVCDIIYATRAVYMRHYSREHDPNSRTVRKCGSEWRINNVRKKHNIVSTPISEEACSKVMTNEPQGCAAKKPAKQRDMMLQMGELYQTESGTHDAVSSICQTEKQTLDAVSSICQEKINVQDDVGSVRIMRQETVPTYEAVTLAVNRKLNTKVLQTQNEITDENYEGNERIQRDLLQNFDAVTNASLYESENEQRFINPANDEVINCTRVINLKRLQQIKNTSTYNAARIVPKMDHTVDAATHTIIINKRKGLDMPMLFDTTPNLSKANALNDRTFKGGKWKPNIPQVFDTMSRDADVSSCIGTHPNSPRSPNMHKVSNNDDADALSSNDTRDRNLVRKIKGRKIRPKMPLVFATRSRDDAGSSTKVNGGKRKIIEYDNQEIFSTMSPDVFTPNITKCRENIMSHYSSNVADAASSKAIATSQRNVFAGKRRPQTANTHKNVEQDETQNYEIVYQGDAACSKSNNTDENIFIGKRKPQLVDVRDRYIEQDVIQNYDFLYEDEAASIQNDAGDRNMFAGKRRPQMDHVRDRYTELDVAQNYEIVSEEDASSSKCNAEGDRNIFAGKRRPQIDDVRDRYIEQEVAQNYEIVCEEDAESSRTIEAMSAISQSADEYADIIAGLSPSKKRKKVNVEMNPTYGYVYSTYHR